MKKTIKAKATPNSWDPEALYLKAQRYVQHMGDFESDSWEYALWSGLTLELLARAALSNISPALLADTDKSWSSLFHALGFAPREEKFAPRSVSISEVFKRLAAIVPHFSKEYENFGILHTGRRNAELHSGEPAFDGIKGSAWQAHFYQTCDVLLSSMGMTLRDFFGHEEANVAKRLIAAATDEDAKATKGEVAAHQKVWVAKSEKDRSTLGAQAAVWATRQAGHRVNCPACSSHALVFGEAISAPIQKLNNGLIIETQEYLPNRFECIACGLRIVGLSRLTVAGVGDRYKKAQEYDAAEPYAPEDELEGYEPDNNEP